MSSDTTSPFLPSEASVSPYRIVTVSAGFTRRIYAFARTIAAK